MTTPEADKRSVERRARDEAIATEPQLAPLNLPADAVSSSVERRLGQPYRHPLAVVGVVENGLVRPLDPTVTLSEQSRVIIVASDGT
jgi:hypothetical protein